MFSTALAMYMYAKMPDCKKWTWRGPDYDRKVICLVWREKEPDKKKK